MKKLFWLLLLTSLLGSTALAAPEVTAPSCILMEASTGQVLYENNADEVLAPASVTKIMTLLLTMEAVEQGQLGWEDTITASSAAAGKGGSQVFLSEGEQMPLWEMVKCVVVSSANDCATALAEAVSGSESGFVEKMNQRAGELGMTGTAFVNCTGLDGENGGNLTTARDIAVMSRELLKYDRIREYTTIWMDTIRNGAFGLSNTNKLVRFYEGTTGLKTGFTDSAGYCMSATAQKDGMELIAVVMHCQTSTDRFESAKGLLDYGFANYRVVSALGDEELPAVSVELGKTETVAPILQTEENVLTEKAARVTREIELAETVSAPVARGQTLGTLRVRCGENVLKEIPLVAASAVERLTAGDVYLQILERMWMGA